MGAISSPESSLPLSSGSLYPRGPCLHRWTRVTRTLGMRLVWELMGEFKSTYLNPHLRLGFTYTFVFDSSHQSLVFASGYVNMHAIYERNTNFKFRKRSSQLKISPEKKSGSNMIRTHDLYHLTVIYGFESLGSLTCNFFPAFFLTA